MSHSDSEKIEPHNDSEETEVKADAVEETEVAEDQTEASEESEKGSIKEPSLSPPPSAMSSDPRFSRLMKMQSRFVTEEALRSTEESSKPKPQGPEEIDEEELEGDYDDEEFDEEFDDDEEEFDEFDDYEDDDYEDEELARPSEAAEAAPTESAPAAEAPTEPEPEGKPEEDTDHKLAQLRKLNTTFVTEEDLEHAATMKEHTYYKDVEVAKVVCPNCQSEEKRTDKICSKCGAKLPNITSVREEKYNPGTLNVAVKKYYNAVEMLQDGTWEAEDFIEFLFERSELSAAHIDGIMEVIEESGSSEWLPQATKLIMDSTLLLEESIDIMLGKVKFTQDEQQHLEAEYDELCLQYDDLLEQAEEDEEIEIPEPPEPPLEVEERVKMINFADELESIRRANGMMLESLRLIDRFQDDEDPEFSM